MKPAGGAAGYALHGIIGVGGFATVHVGKRFGARGFSKTVAIKRLHAQFANDRDCVAMLVDEANVAAQVHHPNVVSSIDLVQEDRELFLVFEYVHGVPLSALRKLATARQVQVPIPIAVSILSGALRGLHAAHEATSATGAPLGVIHRDVSPSNVLVGVDGGARLLDFGVARALGRVVRTADGNIKGKLGYMAPEQLRSEALDRRTDLFAAGAVLWELLAGSALFSGETEAEVIQRTLEGVIPDLVARRPDSPPALGRLLARALSPQASARFQTALDMAEALEACAPPASADAVGQFVRELAGEELTKREAMLAQMNQEPPTLELPGAARTRVARPSRAGRLRWIGLGIAAVLLAAIGVLSWHAQVAQVQPPPAPTQAQAVIVEPPLEAPMVPAATAVEAAPERPVRSKRLEKPKKPARCEPPYSLDSNGHKHFKPECL
jgi:serine/threonine-protein kinase